jgi:hypothetical protein
MVGRPRAQAQGVDPRRVGQPFVVALEFSQ